MEIVILGISNANQKDQNMNQSYVVLVTCLHACIRPQPTLNRSFVAKILGLISAEQALRFDFRRRTSWKFLIEADDPLHTERVWSAPNSLVRGGINVSLDEQIPDSSFQPQS